MIKKTSKVPNIRINKVYTRSGDSGKTRLIGGKECYKNDMRVEAYGVIDELNAHIGLCREMLINQKDTTLAELIHLFQIIQNELFNLGTQLASSDNTNDYKLPHLTDDAVTNLENEIDKANKNLPELESFVLPGGSCINAQFHIARNICRRAERRVVELSRDESIDPINLKYLNRLSDALFVWSRWISLVLNDEEHLWMPNS